jgi:hypothetical protein
MKKAHNDSKADTGGNAGVQAFVRRFAVCCLIGATAMSAAHAGPRDRERDGGQDQRQYDRQYDNRQYDNRQYTDRQPDARRYDSRQSGERQYNARADEQRRNQQAQDQQNAQNSEASRRSGRLTPDERRDLRRQINEAGADIYPSRRRQ